MTEEKEMALGIRKDALSAFIAAMREHRLSSCVKGLLGSCIAKTNESRSVRDEARRFPAGNGLALRRRIAALEEELRRVEDERDSWRGRALYDPLSKLLRREEFVDRINARLASRRKAAERFALVLIDLDGLKEINDRFGHPAGDAVIERLGSIVAGSRRAADLAGRLGGDEFMLCIEDVSREEAVALAEELRARFEETCFRFSGSEFPNEERHPSFSFGIAMAGEDGMTFRELYAVADALLYARKRFRGVGR